MDNTVRVEIGRARKTRTKLKVPAFLLSSRTQSHSPQPQWCAVACLARVRPRVRQTASASVSVSEIVRFLCIRCDWMDIRWQSTFIRFKFEEMKHHRWICMCERNRPWLALDSNGKMSISQKTHIFHYRIARSLPLLHFSLLSQPRTDFTNLKSTIWHNVAHARSFVCAGRGSVDRQKQKTKPVMSERPLYLFKSKSIFKSYGLEMEFDSEFQRNIHGHINLVWSFDTRSDWINDDASISLTLSFIIRLDDNFLCDKLPSKEERHIRWMEMENWFLPMQLQLLSS